MAELFIRNYPAEVENGLPGKDILPMCIYTYIYIYIYTHTYIYIYIYIYICIYIRGYICICISAAVTSRIWLKVYLLAGQPVATRLSWPRGIARSLPKYPVTVSKTLPLPRSRFLALEGMRAPNSPSKSHALALVIERMLFGALRASNWRSSQTSRIP